METPLPPSFFRHADRLILKKLGCYSWQSQEEITLSLKGKDVVFLLFGVTGERVSALFLQASPDVWRWASVLSDGNTDHVQALLTVPQVISYSAASSVLVELLFTLPHETKLRLLTATTFKYRGETCEVGADLLLEVARFWDELGKPDVRQFGRIRCWFSLREDLRKAWEATIPDCPLKQPKKLERLSGKGWTISVPLTLREMEARGRELSNCLGATHVQQINEGLSIILIICEDGVATHAVKIDTTTKKVVSFLGAADRRPDPRIEREVTEALRQAGVVN